MLTLGVPHDTVAASQSSFQLVTVLIDSEVDPLAEVDILSRLVSEENISNLIVVQDGRTAHSGNRRGGTRIPKEIRDLIAESAIRDGVESAAAEWGVAVSTASNYSNGLVSNGKERVQDQRLTKTADEVKADERNKRLEKIEDKEIDAHEAALDSILRSAGIVNDFLTAPEGESVSSTALKLADKAASIASKMSRIPALRKSKDEGIVPRTLIINAPAQQKIDNYEVIDVTSTQHKKAS